MRADENVMRSLFQRKDVSGAATSCPVPESAINTYPIEICCNKWEVMIGDCDDLLPFQKGQPIAMTDWPHGNGLCWIRSACLYEL